ncbi:MAG: M3 family oligoendopeptidase [Anaerolineaceae bacterium]|nr:M3 family oligoendopeptidase [Anaerolineaceae bacterium]
MFETLPTTTQAVMDWEWPQFEAYYNDLAARPLTAENVAAWLTDWTRLLRLIDERGTRLNVATTLDTTDEAAVQRFHHFLETIAEPVESTEQTLKTKLLESGLQPAGFAIPLRNMRTQAELFREANVPLFTQEQKLITEYDKVIGAQTIEWEGEEKTLPQIRPVYQDADRDKRERAWRLASERQLQDRAALNDLWGQFLSLRQEISGNTGHATFRDYRWEAMLRFDYTPADCKTFHNAIEQVVVPAAKRIYERRRQQLGVDTLRPWDLNVDPQNRPPLRPFQDVEVLKSKAEAIFRQVDPQLGDYFATMRRENLLDLDNRKGKAPGGYQTTYSQIKRPFIFMNAVGLHDDVQTLLHEGGHAFHAFESADLPYIQQQEITSEIAEVASMSMELLAAPYLAADQGGYYSEADAARARIEHLESAILFWPYMAVVDAFQHWVYTHAADAADPANCDAKWAELWERFMPGMDWSGLDAAMMTGWHRKLHIFQIPFYYVDYGLAQVGALQVWRNSLADQAGAIRQYRSGLALGGTKPLPQLFAATGAKFAFDAATLGELVALVEKTIAELETVA